MRQWRVLLLVAGLGLLVAAAVLAVTWRLLSLPAGGEGNLDTLADYGRVPDFALVERSDRTVTLADLRGAVWLANFIYTQCTETCPLQSAEAARLQREFAGARVLRLVSITVDPGHDTAATPGCLRRPIRGRPRSLALPHRVQGGHLHAGPGRIQARSQRRGSDPGSEQVPTAGGALAGLRLAWVKGTGHAQLALRPRGPERPHPRLPPD